MKRLFVYSICAAVVCVAGQAQAGLVDIIMNDPGLVSYYRFEGDLTDGAEVPDENGGANPGIVMWGEDGEITPTEGVVGNAALFSGDPFTVVELENEENFDFDEQMTVEAWIKLDTWDKNWQAIVNKGDDQWRLHRRGGECGLAFGRDEDGTNNKDTAAADSDFYFADEEVCVDDEQWHHAVGVFDNVNDLTASVYIDGVLVAQGPDDETIGDLNTEDGDNVDLPVMIGGNAQDGAHWRAFTGAIDEVAIYNRALSADEIMERFTADKTVGPPNVNDVPSEERVDFVHDVLGTWMGDSNLDGEFNSSDFVTVFQAGLFETGEAALWETGDWNGDGTFDSGDFVAAFQDGGFEIGPRPAAAVPEPSSIVLLGLGMLSILRVRKRS